MSDTLIVLAILLPVIALCIVMIAFAASLILDARTKARAVQASIEAEQNSPTTIEKGMNKRLAELQRTSFAIPISNRRYEGMWHSTHKSEKKTK